MDYNCYLLFPRPQALFQNYKFIFTFSAFLFTLLPTSNLLARPELGPPSIKLKSTISNIAILRLIAKDDSGLTFIKVEDLHNKAADKVVIQVNSKEDLGLPLEVNYIVGYIAHKTLKPSKEVVARPGGPVLMNLAGAAPALFAVDEGIQKMFQWDVKQSLTSPAEMLTVILDGLQHPDPHSRAFFIAELVTRPSFLSDEKVQAVIKAMILDQDLPWPDKNFIIAFGGLDDKQMSSEWFCDWSENTLLYASTQFDIHAKEMGLIKSLLENHSKCDGIAKAALSRWVNSNHVGIVEAAIHELREVNLMSTKQLVSGRLENIYLSLNMRSTLSNYLRRLNNEIKQQQSVKNSD